MIHIGRPHTNSVNTEVFIVKSWAGPEETAASGTTNKVGPVGPSEEPSTLGASGVDVQSAPDKSSLLQTLLTSEGPGAINKEPFPAPGYANPTTASASPSENSKPEPGSPRGDSVEQSMFVLPPAAVPDDSAAAQDNEAADGESLGGHLTPAVLGANMAAADEDSHMGFTPDPGQSVAGGADIAALSSMRWPKVSSCRLQPPRRQRTERSFATVPTIGGRSVDTLA